jgi:hypothetical protein
MRSVAKTGLALCFVGAMAIGTAAPVKAQGSSDQRYYATGAPGSHVHGARYRNYSDRRYYAYAPDARMRHGTASHGITPSKAPVSRTGATETTHK